MTTKESVLEAIRNLPDDVTSSEILAELQSFLALEREERETDRTVLLKWFT
jgi:hypothetical protein